MNRSYVISGILTAALFAAPICAFAQVSTDQTVRQADGTQTTTTTTTIQTTSQTQTSPDMVDFSTTNHSIISGSLGGAFGGDTEDGSFGFDGAYDYLHRGTFGFEFLGTFTNDLDLNTGGGAAAGETHVNTYMFNAIGAVPLGLDANWLPYVSGGLGAITLRNELELSADNSVSLIDDNQFGGNIGFGLMGFYNQIGLRADVRYFTGIGTDDTFDATDPDRLNDLTENVNFWRSTVGVSFRW